MKLVIVFQLGTPDSLDKKSVSRYLREFLMDPRVINIPRLLRFILVNWIIVPKRTPKVIERYKLIWDNEKGSPLKYHGDNLIAGLEQELPENYKVVQAMRYGSPSIESVMKSIPELLPEELIYVPLFPHHADATTGSILSEIGKWERELSLKLKSRVVPVFQDSQKYIEALARKLLVYNPDKYDKILFSFHGLPLKHIEVDHKGESCESLGCADLKKELNQYCYTRNCYITAQKVAEIAGLQEDNYHVAFQSRFGSKWIGPQSEDIIKEWAEQGKSILVIAPSFLTDCLETSWEVGISFRQLFTSRGGGRFEWVPSLNSDPAWSKALSEIIMND